MPSGLLERIASGDRSAVEECLDCYGELVWALSLRYLSNRSEAEDAVQEIFIDVWRHAGRFDKNVASEATFIAMIARRRLIDFRRKRARTVTTASISEDVSGAMESAEDTFVSGEEVDGIREQLARLRPIERRVIELAIDEGLSQSEIAEVLEIPLGTVKTIARRGMIHLREVFRGTMPSQRSQGGES